MSPGPAQPDQAAHRCTAAPRATHPDSATRALRGEGKRRGRRSGVGVGERSRPGPTSSGHRARAAGRRGERMLARGGAAVGEGSRPDSHSPPRSPPGPSSAVPAPALTARVSSRGSTSSEDAQSCGQVGASGGHAASGAESVGKMGLSSRRHRGHHSHGRRRLFSATEAADPPTTPASRLPRRPPEE